MFDLLFFSIKFVLNHFSLTNSIIQHNNKKNFFLLVTWNLILIFFWGGERDTEIKIKKHNRITKMLLHKNLFRNITKINKIIRLTLMQITILARALLDPLLSQSHVIVTKSYTIFRAWKCSLKKS